jgi:hypothetical protein
MRSNPLRLRRTPVQAARPLLAHSRTDRTVAPPAPDSACVPFRGRRVVVPTAVWRRVLKCESGPKALRLT